MDQRLCRMLAEGKIGSYLRATPGVYRRWASGPRALDDAAVSLGRDGTALVVRIVPTRH